MKKINITFFLITLLNITVLSQGLTIGSGTTITGGSANIILPGNWNNSGTFIPATSSIIFNGASGNQTIANSNGETFNNLITNKAANNVLLSNNITVNGTLTLSSGNLDLNSKSLSLGSNANVSESIGNIVLGGTLSITQTINSPASKNIGGLGAELTSSSNFGSTIITRGSSIQTGNSNSSIKRYYDITPTNNAGLNATLVFHYDPVELNGLTESTLILFKSTDNGTTWINAGGTVNTTTHTVTLSGIDSFSRWTLGSSSSPLTTPPTTQASNITFSSIQTTQATISWTNGNGTNRAVFIYQGNSGTASPVDATTYTANTVFGSGTQIVTNTGWYCVYNGTGTSVTVTNLTAGTEYRVMVTEYNGSAGSEAYNTNSGTNNPNNVTTKLATPTLSSPSNNATGQSLSPTLSWEAVTGADQYTLEVNSDAGFGGTTAITVTGQPQSGLSKVLGGLSDNTTYYWRVSAGNSGTGNTSDVSSVFSFTTTQQGAGTSPVDASSNISINPVFIWPAGPTGTNKYRLEVNTNNTFTGTTILDTTTTVTSKTLDGTSLSYNTIYYWRVTAQSNALAKTNASVVYSFTTQLAASTLISPANNATDVSLSPILIWSATGGTTGYRLEVNTASNFSGTVIYNQDNISQTSKQIGGLIDNTKYYWRVTVIGSGGVSDVSNFTTAKAASGDVTLVSPPPSTIDASTSPNLSWPATSGASKYHLEVNTASDFTGTVVFDANVISTSLPLTGLSYNTTYYWRVTATSNSLSKTTTTVYSFTTKLAPPTLLSPADSTVGVSIDPVLVWSAMTNVTRYNLLMSTNYNFTTVVLQKQLPDTSYHLVTNLESSTKYYWKVSAVNSQGNAGEYTSPASFTTGTTALPVELMDFSANVVEDKVHLGWKTATEVNNYGFEVERKDGRWETGDGRWEKIGFVAGHGNSNSPKSYSFTDQATGGTSFSYRIKQIDNDGKYKYYDAISVKLDQLATAELMQNSPNPFNPSTAIKFYVPNNSDVTIKIYDILGKEVTTLIKEQTTAGYHIVYWNGRNNYGYTVSSGMYLYRLTAGNFSVTKKMVMMK